MRILGIDYGRKKMGLAISEGVLAQPYDVIKFDSIPQAIKKILDIVKKEDLEKVVIGISEGKMEDEEREFGRMLGRYIKQPVDYFDETLTTHDAQTYSLQAGIKRSKRKAMEDAYAAALILQNYLASF